MKTIVPLFALCLVFARLQAATIYSQPPAAGITGYPSARFTVNGHNSDEFVWDSFSTTTTKTLREIQWRGSRSGTTPVDFEISINTVALPGGTTWHLNSNADETPPGTPGVYDYRFTLPAGFVLTGGQTYWLRIIAVQNEWPTWQWSTGTGGNGSHFAQVPAITGDYRYINTAGDVAFTLLNAATVPVTISVNAFQDAGGTVTGGGTYQPGTNVTVQATPAADRTFLNWTEAGIVVSASADYTFVADGHKTLSANFSGPNTGPYVISAVANPSVNGHIGGAGTFNADEVVDLDVSAADGVSFVGWTENGELVDLPYLGDGLFQIIATADRSLIANFSYPNYTYYINRAVSPANAGSIVTSPSPGLPIGSHYGGTIITLTAAPAQGYRFSYWRQGAGIGDLSGMPHFVSSNSVLRHMVCYGTTLTAVFEPSNPVLTVTPFPVGGGTVTGAGTFVNGTTVTVNAVPAAGYAFESWRIVPNVVSFEASYTFPITTHSALTAIFVATTNSVTAAAAPVESGSVTGAGVFGHGVTVTLTAIPAPGYAFDNWTLGGAPAGTNNPVTFDALADYAFVANFTAGSTPAAPPQVAFVASTPGVLILQWPTNAAGFVLEQSSTLGSTNWVTFAGPTTIVDTNYQVTISTQTGSGFFRLVHP
jgi:hypothetical protein